MPIFLGEVKRDVRMDFESAFLSLSVSMMASSAIRQLLLETATRSGIAQVFRQFIGSIVEHGDS